MGTRGQVPADVKAAMAAAEEATRLVNEGRYAEAEPILRGIRDTARQAGWGHATISHQLSWVLFRLDRLEEALELVNEAISHEPLSRLHHDTFGAIMQRMREVIEAADLAPEDPRIPRFHALIAQEQEETTVETHLALLRHLCAVGKRAEAERFAKALRLLHPGHPEVWRYRTGIEAEGGAPTDERSGALAMLSILPSAVAKA